MDKNISDTPNTYSSSTHFTLTQISIAFPQFFSEKEELYILKDRICGI